MDCRKICLCGIALSVLAFAALPSRAVNANGGAVPYRVSLSGIGIGDLALEVTRGPDFYAVEADGSYRVLFWSGEINGQTIGQIGSAGPEPAQFRISSVSDNPSSTRIDFDPSRGPTYWQRIPPAPAEWSEGRMALRDEHLEGALDPLTALSALALVAEPVSPASLCDREIRVFTGFVVFALVLEGAGEAETAGIACAARYQPLSGHRAGSSMVSRLTEPGAIDVSFLPSADGTWHLERIALPTSAGTLAVTIQE